MWLHLFSQADPNDPASTHIASYLLGSLLSALTEYISNTSQTVMAIVLASATLLLTGYVVLWGMGIATGHIREAFSDGAKRIIRIALIINFALGASIYQDQIRDFFLQVPIDTANRILTGNSFLSAVTSVGCTISSTLDADAASLESPADIKLGYFSSLLDCAMGQGIKMGNAVENFGLKSAAVMGIPGLEKNGLPLLIYGATAAIVAQAVATIFITFMVLALLLGLGPIFILLAIFPSTQRYFTSWLGQLVTYVILFILVASVMSICFQYFYIKFIFSLPFSDHKQIIVNSVKVMGASVAVLMVLRQVHSLASALGNGFAMGAEAGMSRIFESGIGGGGRGVGGLRAMSNAALRGISEGGDSPVARQIADTSQRNARKIWDKKR